MLAAGVAPVSTQTPATNNGYDVSTGSTNVQSDNLGLSRIVTDGDKRRAQARKGDNASSAQTSLLHMLQPQPGYIEYPVYVSVTGDMPIRMRLSRKADGINSVHGGYVPGNAADVCLVAGGYKNDDFLMRGFNDDVHVTGTQEGAIDGHGIVHGTRTDVAHDGHALPFMLRPVTVVVIPPYDATTSNNATMPATPMTLLIPAGPGQVAPSAGKPTRLSAHW